MSNIYGRNTFGLWNGTFDHPNWQPNFGINTTTVEDGGVLPGTKYLRGVGYHQFISFASQIPVDTSKSYQMIVYLKTIQPGGTSGTTLASSLIGFSCYDRLGQFVDLIHCGGIGNTTLTRPLNPGDTKVYIASNTGWYVGATNSNVSHRLGVYPPSHPEYNVPYEYTRLSGYIYDPTSIPLTGSGDYEITLTAPFPNIGYECPVGTPIMNARLGSTYNYVFNRVHPLEWTRYASSIFTGENRNSATPFRFGTKFVRFMILVNYNNRLDPVQDHVWGLDRIFFGEVYPGRGPYDRV